MSETRDIIEELREALEAAEGHLDFCGYGDSYERSCAGDVPNKIEKALENSRRFLDR